MVTLKMLIEPKRPLISRSRSFLGKECLVLNQEDKMGNPTLRYVQDPNVLP